MSVLKLRVVLIGLIATITMDTLSVTALKTGWIAFLPPRLTGRWFASIARGQVIHDDIAQAPPVSYEIAIAVPIHYAIGITLGFLYVFATAVAGVSDRNPICAISFALCTTLLPWLFMFSAMGYGYFGVHGPGGNRLFISSLVTHCFYGVGLWLAASVLG